MAPMWKLPVLSSIGANLLQTTDHSVSISIKTMLHCLLLLLLLLLMSRLDALQFEMSKNQRKTLKKLMHRINVSVDGQLSREEY